MPESLANCSHCLFPEPLYIQVIWLFAQPPKIIKSTGLLFSEDNTSSIKTVALEKNSWVSFGRREWKYSPTSTVTVDSPSTKASDGWIHTCFKYGYGVKPVETIFGYIWGDEHPKLPTILGFTEMPRLWTALTNCHIWGHIFHTCANTCIPRVFDHCDKELLRIVRAQSLEHLFTGHFQILPSRYRHQLRLSHVET